MHYFILSSSNTRLGRRSSLGFRLTHWSPVVHYRVSNIKTNLSALFDMLATFERYCTMLLQAALNPAHLSVTLFADSFRICNTGTMPCISDSAASSSPRVAQWQSS